MYTTQCIHFPPGQETKQSLEQSLARLSDHLTDTVQEATSPLQASLVSLQAQASSPPVTTTQLLEVHQALSNITAGLEEGGAERQVRTLYWWGRQSVQEVALRVASLEQGLEDISGQGGQFVVNLETVEERLVALEQGGGDWEARVRGLVLRINQFQQSVLTVQVRGRGRLSPLIITLQKLPQQIQQLYNRIKRLENL